MGDIHLLGSNLHVLWLCLTYTVRFESIVLFIHILSTHNLLFLNIFLTPPPFVSNGQHSTYPPSPPRQQWSAFGLPPLPPSSAMVSICHTPSPPSGGWRNMWTAPNCAKPVIACHTLMNIRMEKISFRGEIKELTINSLEVSKICMSKMGVILNLGIKKNSLSQEFFGWFSCMIWRAYYWQ